MKKKSTTLKVILIQASVLISSSSPFRTQAADEVPHEETIQIRTIASTAHEVRFKHLMAKCQTRLQGYDEKTSNEICQQTVAEMFSTIAQH